MVCMKDILPINKSTMINRWILLQRGGKKDKNNNNHHKQESFVPASVCCKWQISKRASERPYLVTHFYSHSAFFHEYRTFGNLIISTDRILKSLIKESTAVTILLR